MYSLWLVAKHEYRRIVARRGFIFGTVAVPLGLAALIAVGILAEELGRNRLPMGYVDHAGFLEVSRQGDLPDAQDRIAIRAYTDESSALSALEREEIQAYFVFPADYLGTRRTALYYLEEAPGDDAWSQFDDFVRLNLVAALPDEVQQRVLEGSRVAVWDTISGREFSEDSIINVVLPFVASSLLFFASASASGYMFRVVADEKGNRTMEVMVTSVTPGRLIGGKALGLMAATATQLLVYGIALVVGLSVAAPYVEMLQSIVVPWTYLGVMALLFVPTYVLIAAVMVVIGAAVTDTQQGQQLAGLISLLFMFPLFTLALLFENPSHPAVLFMTFFPTSAFLTISLRWGLSTVPVWQWGASWLILVISAVLAVWVAAKVFRIGMLRYGQPLSLRVGLAAIRGR